MAVDLEKYKKMLIEERDRLNQELGGAVEVDGQVTDDPLLTPSDAPVIDETLDVRSAVVDMKTHRLRRVLAALDSIDDGTYGKCTRCGREIDPRRLDADPAAMLCIDDARKESEFETPSL